MKTTTNRIHRNGATKSATLQRQNPVSPFSRVKLSQTIGEPIVSVQACAAGWNLRLIALAGSSIDELQVFTDDEGCFYLDRSITLNTKKFSSSKFGEYVVNRQRQHVTREFALATWLTAIVPPEFSDLMKPLYRSWGDFC